MSCLSGESAVTYPFGIISLCNKRCPPDGTQVEFQVAQVSGQVDRAINVMVVKDVVNGKVDSIRGPTGFLDIENREKKVYFRYCLLYCTNDGINVFVI